MSLKSIYKQAGNNAQDEEFDINAFKSILPRYSSSRTILAKEAALQLLKEPEYSARGRAPAQAISPEQAISAARAIMESATPSPERQLCGPGLLSNCRILLFGQNTTPLKTNTKSLTEQTKDDISFAMLVVLFMTSLLWLIPNQTQLVDAGCLAMMRSASGIAYMAVVETFGCKRAPTPARTISNCLLVLVASLLGGCMSVQRL